ncbi:MAG: DNA polymerase III subunit delta' [Gammaproteobacteria bacterium]|nr:DNA polymerase III subunit delta' [Gammaproteobacteria bacterium]NIV75175.1 DNA polymerase III subunit delta' [Gammaproteobacteria bacterium]
MAEPAGPAQPLPWHRAQWERAGRILRAGRLPHALLLTGPEGLGKRRFAERLAQGLLCAERAADMTPCGACQGCRLFAAGSHPDWRVLEPEGPGKPIRVEAVRELTEALRLTSQTGGYRLALIVPAERMNPHAANALLKTLEEPVPQTLLMLVTARPARLLPTIRSRCQAFTFAPPPVAEGERWLAAEGVGRETASVALAVTGGAPLTALELAGSERLQTRRAFFEDWVAVAAGEADPIGVAGRWAKGELKILLDFAATWIMDALRLRAVEADAPRLANPDLTGSLRRLTEDVDLKALHEHLDRVLETARLTEHPLNPQLLLEGVLLDAAWILAGRARVAHRRLHGEDG